MSKKRISGYQVMYATNKKFTTGKETSTVKKYQSNRLKVKELRSGKKYFVRVRTFMKVSGKQYYSPWSKIKSVKTK
jgi:predicted chitinase